jgi:putative hydrolase of the HAD superfamily
MSSRNGEDAVIRTFLFDMGNVLVHFSHERMCAQIGALCDKPASEIRSLLFDTGLQHDFERGWISEAELHRRLEEAAGRSIDFNRLRRAGSDIFHLNATIVPLLDALRARGRRLVLLSNTSISHYEFVRDEFEVLDRFDDLVLSFRVGAIKPEAAIFHAALDAIHCDPVECFYTDDIAAYVAAGRSFGLQAEVFTDTATLVDQLRARGISLDGTMISVD